MSSRSPTCKLAGRSDWQTTSDLRPRRRWRWSLHGADEALRIQPGWLGKVRYVYVIKEMINVIDDLCYQIIRRIIDLDEEIFWFSLICCINQLNASYFVGSIQGIGVVAHKNSTARWAHMTRSMFDGTHNHQLSWTMCRLKLVTQIAIFADRFLSGKTSTLIMESFVLLLSVY